MFLVDGIRLGTEVQYLLDLGWEFKEEGSQTTFFTYRGAAGFQSTAEVKDGLVISVMGQTLRRNDELLLSTNQEMERDRRDVFTALSIPIDPDTMETFAAEPPDRMNIKAWGLTLFFRENKLWLIELEKSLEPGPADRTGLAGAGEI